MQSGRPHCNGVPFRNRMSTLSAGPMPPLVIAVPGRLDTPTGGYIYDRRMAQGLSERGWSVEVRELDDSFPHPTPAALEHAARVLSDLPNRTRVVVDGLALGAMPHVIEHEARRLRIIALVHLPLGADISIDRHTGALLEAFERRSFAAATLIIVTGTSTLALLARYGIASDKIVVVEPGTARAPLARGSGTMPLRLLSVATLNPNKGHEILMEALSTVPHRDWHLTCAGSLTRHPETADRVRAAIRRLGLDDRVTLAGELDAETLDEHYDRADVFVLATLQETYGMAVAEALARGLPVVSTTTGAIPDLVGADAGLLAPPGDAMTFAGALARVMEDVQLRAQLAEGARRVRDRLPDWECACSRMAAALERLDG
jgi:glycosyltransferase involved in cell wall biosynthesis